MDRLNGTTVAPIKVSGQPASRAADEKSPFQALKDVLLKGRTEAGSKTGLMLSFRGEPDRTKEVIQNLDAIPNAQEIGENATDADFVSANAEAITKFVKAFVPLFKVGKGSSAVEKQIAILGFLKQSILGGLSDSGAIKSLAKHLGEAASKEGTPEHALMVQFEQMFPASQMSAPTTPPGIVPVIQIKLPPASLKSEVFVLLQKYDGRLDQQSDSNKAVILDLQLM